MKTVTLTCDITDRKHDGEVKEISLDVIFDHDQEDALSKMKPYFQRSTIHMCEACRDYMFKEKRYIYGYGAMGFNKYYLGSTN